MRAGPWLCAAWRQPPAPAQAGLMEAAGLSTTVPPAAGLARITAVNSKAKQAAHICSPGSGSDMTCIAEQCTQNRQVV
jgi:hypothetical protein